MAQVWQQGFKGAGKYKRAQQDADNRYSLNEAVCLGEVFTAHEFSDIAVFGGAVDRALGCQRQRHGEGTPKPAEVVEQRDQQRRQHGGKSGPLNDPGFRILVRQKTRRRKQQNKWQQYQRVDDCGEDDLLLTVVGLEHRVLDNDFVAQVDEGVEEDHDHIRDIAGDA